jgi:hypothetical protein
MAGAASGAANNIVHQAGRCPGVQAALMTVQGHSVADLRRPNGTPRPQASESRHDLRVVTHARYPHKPRSTIMPDEDSHSTKARHIPWNKGKLIGAKPPLAAKPSLVDPNPPPDRKTDPRPCPFQPCDRQQVAWLRRRRLEDRRCRSEWLCGRSCDRTTEEDREAGQVRVDGSNPVSR